MLLDTLHVQSAMTCPTALPVRVHHAASDLALRIGEERELRTTVMMSLQQSPFLIEPQALQQQRPTDRSETSADTVQAATITNMMVPCSLCYAISIRCPKYASKADWHTSLICERPHLCSRPGHSPSTTQDQTNLHFFAFRRFGAAI